MTSRTHNTLLSAIMLITASGSAALGQDSILSYDRNFGTRSTQTASGNFFDLVSDISLRAWQTSYNKYFERNDMNGDGVLNKRDLATLDAQLIVQWMNEKTPAIFTFWGPLLSQHLSGIDREIARASGQHSELQEYTSVSAKIRQIFSNLGLTAAAESPVYIHTIKDPDAETAISSEGFLENGRKWYSGDIPVLLTVVNGPTKTQYRYTIHVMAVRKFARHEHDDVMIMGDIGVSERN